MPSLVFRFAGVWPAGLVPGFGGWQRARVAAAGGPPLGLPPGTWRHPGCRETGENAGALGPRYLQTYAGQRLIVTAMSFALRACDYLRRAGYVRVILPLAPGGADPR